MKTLLTNGKLITMSGIIQKDIIINEKGIIEDVLPIGEHSPSTQIVDLEGNYVLPGMIEVHGHMREPGLTEKEDVPHGTRAAIAGGFTTIIDMPNTKPPTTTVALLKEKITKIYPGRSHTDYAFFIGASKNSLDELKKVNKDDIVGVKVFMAGHETTPTTIPDDKTLGEIFQILAKRNILFALHAEDQYLINYYTKKYKQSGNSNASVWSKARPKEVVVTAVSRAIALAEQYKTRIYLLHLSTPEEFALVHAAKKRGVEVYGELVSYQLIFTIADYKKYGNKIKVAPALRSREDQNELWKMVQEGGIDVLCSEHTPHEWETKNQPDVWKAQSGTPNIQETLPALITAWIKKYGKKSIEEGLIKIARYASYNPAKIFGFTSKGSIEKGKDADLVIIDPKRTWTVQKRDLFSKCGWSAYEGMKLVGRPVKTFLRGELIYNQGNIIQKHAIGKMVK